MRKGYAKSLYRDCRAEAEVYLDGEGKATVSSGSGFLDHMLTALARTSGWDLKAKNEPGIYKIEALGAAIGQALDRSLGAVPYTHPRAHETVIDLVCRLLLVKQNTQ